MDKFIEVFNSLVVESFNQVYKFIAQYGPGIAFSLVLMVSGWLCAIVIRKIVTKLLRAFGFDVLSEKTGFKRFLENGGIENKPSVLVGRIIYWIILLNAFIMAQDALDLEVTSLLIQNTVLYIPKIIVVVIIIALGIFLGEFAYKFVDKTAKFAAIPIHSFLGTIARYTVLGFTTIVTLQYLNIPDFAMAKSMIIIFAVIPVFVCLVFFVSGKDAFANIINGRFLLHELKEGDFIEFDSVSGEIVCIGTISTKLRSGEEEFIIPNSELSKKVIKRKKNR